jgi:CTP synthase (UTP-ammonia lyase)
MIGVIGDFKPGNVTHKTLDASLAHAGAEWQWIPTTEVPAADELEARYSGLWVAPASPYRDMNGALSAITTARERGVPLVGTCGGFQHVIVEYARNVLGVSDAEHAESSPDADSLVVTPLSCSLVGLSHPVHLEPDSRAAKLYGTVDTIEDFYCNYGLNPE